MTQPKSKLSHRAGMMVAVIIAAIATPAVASAAVCPTLHSEYLQRKKSIHLNLVSARRAAHHQHQQRLIQIKHQRAQAAALCHPQRAAVIQQLNYQRTLAHQQLRATLQRLNFENQVARQQLNAWYADQQRRPYCGCQVCQGHAPPPPCANPSRVQVGYGVSGVALPHVPSVILGGGSYGSAATWDLPVNNFRTTNRGLQFSLRLGR